MTTAELRIRHMEPSTTTMALAGAALAVCYAAVSAQLVRAWSINPLYSYGFAVPLISGYIVATRWRSFRSAMGAPDYVWGMPAVVLAALMLAVGELGSALRLQELSLVLMVAGSVLLLFGRQAFRFVWFAIAYLLLMVPIWTDALSYLPV